MPDETVAGLDIRETHSRRFTQAKPARRTTFDVGNAHRPGVPSVPPRRTCPPDMKENSQLDDNPYASPENVEHEVQGDDAVDADDVKDAEPTLQSHQIQARRCILFVALVCGVMSASMLFGFFVNLSFKYPDTGKSVYEVAPLWLAGRAMYGIGFGALTWCLIRYQSAIKRWDTPQSVGSEEFLDVHSRFWRAVAQVLFVFAGYVIIYMVFASLDFAS